MLSGCWAQFEGGTTARYSFANTSRTTAPVRSMSPAVCAVEMKPVSNCDGAK